MAHVKPMTIHCSTSFSWAARRFQEMQEMHSSEFPKLGVFLGVPMTSSNYSIWRSPSVATKSAEFLALSCQSGTG